MKEHDATEIAFKNGYKQGAMDAFAEIEKILRYRGLMGRLNVTALYSDYVELKKKYTEDKR